MSKKILVVDDEPNNLKVMMGILSTAGYTLAFAKDGRSGLEGARLHEPDLVLLDVMMPDMDGYEVCRSLKADPALSRIPVIFVTALGEVKDEAVGFEMGAVDYIIKPVSAPIVLSRVATHLSLVRVEEMDALARSAIRMLGEAGHYNDTDTGEHIWRMAAYARGLGEAAGLSEERAEMLELAAPLHDTGKIGIPDAILKAPRKLTAQEWEVMKTHSTIGGDILSMSHNPVFKTAAEIAYGHHERWDGAGYPKGTAGDAIPESARIVAVSDVFDALTNIRPYKKAWSIEESMAEIKRTAGSHLDPRLVELFIGIEDQIRRIKIKWDQRELDSNIS